MQILIVGCGRLGAGLARYLVKQGQQVTVIDQDPQAFQALGSDFSGSQVTGLAFDREVLRRAGASQADGFVAALSTDESNVVAARMAGQVFRIPHVISCLVHPASEPVYRRLGLQVVSTPAWGAERIGEMLVRSEGGTMTELGSGGVKMVEAWAPYRLIGSPASQLSEPGEFTLVAITRSGSTLLPEAGTVLKESDIVHLAVTSGALERVYRLLGKRVGE